MSRIPNYSSLGAGPVVLFLHGIGGGHLAFAPQLETMAEAGFRAVAWDMPGYGHSDPIEPYTFKGLAEKCIALIEALASRHGPQVSLVGHSMGGMVAQEVMVRRPDLVRQLVLCGTSASFGRADGEWQRQFIEQRMAPLLAGQTMADVARRLVPAMAGPRALPEGLRLAEHCMSGVNPGTYRRALEALVTFDRRTELSQIAAPTLLVAGENDPNAPPEVMQKMGQRILGSKMVVMPGNGHLMNLESPDDFDPLLIGFLRENHTLVRH
ncbi:MAG: alpha/beta fold hydrolase [Alphaproteobacteria bacterium]|nr:alpha/beta fold hydrolase [Alphaproteobacteria bacterium]